MLSSISSIGGGGGTKVGGPLSLFGLGGGEGSAFVVGGRGALRLGVMEGADVVRAVRVVSILDVVTDTLRSDPVGEAACRIRVAATSEGELSVLLEMKSHDIVLSIVAGCV